MFLKVHLWEQNLRMVCVCFCQSLHDILLSSIKFDISDSQFTSHIYLLKEE